MSDVSLPEKAVALANEKWGRLDSLIINHGTLDPVKKVAESSAEEWRKGFDINVFSAVGLVRIYLVFALLSRLLVLPLQNLRKSISAWLITHPL